MDRQEKIDALKTLIEILEWNPDLVAPSMDTFFFFTYEKSELDAWSRQLGELIRENPDSDIYNFIIEGRIAGVRTLIYGQK